MERLLSSSFNSGLSDSSKFDAIQRTTGDYAGVVYPRRREKWMITLVNNETGEVVRYTDLERYMWRRRKRMRKAFKMMRHLYRSKVVSLLLITLTLPKGVDITVVKGRFRRWRENYKRRLKRHGVKWYGDVWVLERGSRSGIWHYHIVVVIGRLNIKGGKLPWWLKADDWGYISRVEFVRRDVEAYLSNYLQKPPPEVPRYTRTYGVNIRLLQIIFYDYIRHNRTHRPNRPTRPNRTHRPNRTYKPRSPP